MNGSEIRQVDMATFTGLTKDVERDTQLDQKSIVIYSRQQLRSGRNDTENSTFQGSVPAKLTKSFPHGSRKADVTSYFHLAPDD